MENNYKCIYNPETGRILAICRPEQDHLAVQNNYPNSLITEISELGLNPKGFNWRIDPKTQQLVKN